MGRARLGRSAQAVHRTLVLWANRGLARYLGAQGLAVFADTGGGSGAQRRDGENSGSAGGFDSVRGGGGDAVRAGPRQLPECRHLSCASARVDRLAGLTLPACGHDIRWHDNLPVVGWLLLRGRCRDCGAPISQRYPLVEGLTGALFLVGFPRVRHAGSALAHVGVPGRARRDHLHRHRFLHHPRPYRAAGGGRGPHRVDRAGTRITGGSTWSLRSVRLRSCWFWP